MIRSFEEQERSPSIPEIVDIFVDPFIHLLKEKGETGRRFLRFVARLRSDRNYTTRDVEYKHFPEIIDRLEVWTRDACPGIPDDERELRMTMVLDTVFQTLSTADFMTREWLDSDEDEQLQRLVAQLKSFLVAGLAAPPAKF
jgi:hypothetical protein